MMISETLLAENPKNNLSDFTKFIFLAAAFVTTFISSLLPLQIVSRFRNVIDPQKRLLYLRIVSAMNCFAGGVFMGTALLDLFPQVTSLMKDAFPNNRFPFAEFVVAFGLLLILSIEQIAKDCNDKTGDDRNPIERLQSRNSQLERENLTANAQIELNTPPSPPFPDPNPVNSQSKFNSVILLLALSVHSLFEGLTIGILKSPSVVLQIFIAILVHKIPIAFSLGLNLVQSELKVSAVIQFDLWFSLMTPIGAGIGVLLNTLTSDVDVQLLNGILIGLSTGTFMFIVFVEVLPKELKHEGPRLLNLIFLLLGFSVVCIAVLVETTLM